MTPKKQQKIPVSISAAHVAVTSYKLLSYKSSKSNPPADENASQAKKKTPLFYERPIHKARKHELF
jgi:hypothetical protein